MNSNGQDKSEHKIQIKCPCSQVFSVRMPEGETMNNLRYSIFCAPHEKPFKCVSCGRVFVALIQGVNVLWGAVVITDDQAALLEVNRVLRPI